MQALPGTLSCGCCDCRYGHDWWALRTYLTRSLWHRISASTHMRMENVAAFEKIVFFCSKCYNRNIPNTKGRKRPCQDRHGAVGFVACHRSIHSVWSVRSPLIRKWLPEWIQRFWLSLLISLLRSRRKIYMSAASSMSWQRVSNETVFWCDVGDAADHVQGAGSAAGRISLCRSGTYRLRHDTYDPWADRPAHQLGTGGSGTDAQKILGGRTGGAEAWCNHAAG